MAMLFDLAATAAHRTHQAVASCAGSLASQVAVPSTLLHFAPQPNIALQLTPTASLLVPCASLRRR
jgi:FAD synthase